MTLFRRVVPTLLLSMSLAGPALAQQLPPLPEVESVPKACFGPGCVATSRPTASAAPTAALPAWKSIWRGKWLPGHSAARTRPSLLASLPRTASRSCRRGGSTF